MYGIDVEKSRVDELDKQAIKFAISLKNKKKKALELGCGSSRIGIILSLLGWETLAYDKQDYSKHFSDLAQQLHIKFTFQQKDITKLKFTQAKDAQIVILNRVLHYLPYKTAIKLLKRLHKNLPAGARVFVSVTGINSPVAKGYPCKKEKIEKRYCKLPPSQAEKFKIHTEVCLYNKKELQTLLEEAGFKVIRIWRSRFKNIKAIAQKL